MKNQRYWAVLFLMGLTQTTAAQGNPARTANDPDDSIVVGKTKAALPAAAAPLRWQQVDSAFGSLPSSIHVYRTQDSLQGKPSVAYYVSAPLNDKSLTF